MCGGFCCVHARDGGGGKKTCLTVGPASSYVQSTHVVQIAGLKAGCGGEHWLPDLSRSPPLPVVWEEAVARRPAGM